MDWLRWFPTMTSSISDLW